MLSKTRAALVVLILALLGAVAFGAGSALAGPCDAPTNAVTCENSKAGNPSSEWDIAGDGDDSIQGFSTEVSVNQGETARFKVSTASSKYRLDIYRMGYYGGMGARKVATIKPSVSLPQFQPSCKTESSTGLIDCGNWAQSATWAVPTDAVSGIYFAHLVREDKTSEGSHIVFVVRDDDGKSDLLFQTSDTTWQAYNDYGGNSLYEGGPGTGPSRAYKVSYNRPVTTREGAPEDSPFNAEYPMVRWLERNGYDVSYFTGVDADRFGSEMLEHQVYLSVGHDEYWSGTQRANVEAARNAGVDLAFFSGNEVFWKTRWEKSIDGSGTERRTLVCYKETHANAKIDPFSSKVWTGTWRDPRFSPPADGGRPENQLTGTIFTVNSGTTAIKVPAADGKMRFWRDTDIASLAAGKTATLPEGTLGYEWDEDLDNGFRPPGLARLSSTTASVPQRILDYGSNYGPGTATHHLTLYRAPSGALVFGAGTVQWSWGLDGNHDRDSSTPDSRMQQATVNLFADMGPQPRTLQAGLTKATATTDVDPPSATIATPFEGTEVEIGHPVTVSGSASDTEGETKAGGEVASVEVSMDGGSTWHPAEGREEWSYSWTPKTIGETTIVARAVDDSGNLQAPGDQAAVEVVPQTCPCTIWSESMTGPQDPDTNSVEVGVKFRSELDGLVTGLRYYRTAGNTGTHVGRLWTASGTSLASVTFSGESSTGWQEATFKSPVAITADTNYVAAYHSPNGRYASIASFFSVVGYDNPPLYALADGEDGANGIYNYGSAGVLFSNGGPNSFQSENYLVDVVFEGKEEKDTTPPKAVSTSPVAGATGVSTETTVSAAFSEPLDPATVKSATVQLRDGSEALVPATISYNAGQRRAIIDPVDPLSHSSGYTATIKGVTDTSGNALVGTVSWSFSTAGPPPPPPDQGPGGPILVIVNGANPFSQFYAEILRAEGLNEFAAVDMSTVTPAMLDAHDVAILGEGSVSPGQATMLQTWVEGGGNLIAMRPDSDLLGLLGLGSPSGSLGNAYLKVDTSKSPGAGIVGQTIQFHGVADRYTASGGAQTVATLFSNASTATANPAVTLRAVGSKGGSAAAFTYDLAKSVVYTRQGNPAWAGQDRDGISPVRSNDMFFGPMAGDVQPNWIDFNKVQIPQADEQQRLLTNLIGEMNSDRKPLPRFWFLPRDEKAAVVMTGDDHANGGTLGRFAQYKEMSSPGCEVEVWECVRGTSYIYPNTTFTDAQVAEYVKDGFEFGLHLFTGCSDWADQADLETLFSNQLTSLEANFPSMPPTSTHRTHCIVWSDWATEAKVELLNGIRLDTNYYYWPESWIQNRPGLFTGSGMPMRFADVDGSLIDVYQAATQMNDEANQSYPATADVLLDNALGSQGYYGVFTANMHTDDVKSSGSDAIVASALARDVPVVSSHQMLAWLDGRNQSSFGSIEWSGSKLTFSISPGSGATGLRAMVPTSSLVGGLQTIKRGETVVTPTLRTIKGVEYAFFDAIAGKYTVAYLDKTGPVISNVKAVAGADGTATVTWTTDEPSDSRVEYGLKPEALTSSKSDSAQVTSHSVQLSGLNPEVTYHFRVQSFDESANSSTSPALPGAPQTFLTAPATPVLSTTSPPSPANNNTPKVLGSAGAGTTVNLFSGADCSGSPIATVTPAALAAGVSVSVANDSTTSFRATATSSAKLTSGCSTPLVYVEDSIAPDTAIESGPPSLSVSNQATFSFKGTDTGSGVTSFQCRLDSEAGAWIACSSPQKYESLADSNHKFEVRALDKAGNPDASPAIYSWLVDTKAPETELTAQPAAISPSASASFSFKSTDTGSGIASFQCRLDSEAGAWNACSSPQPYSSLSDGNHKFEVRGIDKAGNADASPAVFSWLVDTKAPDTELTAQPAAISPSASASFSFKGTDTGSGVVSFECRLDSEGAWNACSSPQPYSSLTEGSHKFEVRTLDKAGNADASPAIYSWLVDTKAPDTELTAQPSAISPSAAASFSFKGTDSGSGIASFECRLDSEGAWNACTSPQPYTSLAEGTHKFEVRALDKAGNADASPAIYSWLVDTKAPDTELTAQPAAISPSASASVSFKGTDTGSGIASFECRLDSEGAWNTCTSPQPYSSLSDGSHKFEVRALDKAGNPDTSPAVFTWQVDTKAPETELTAQPSPISPSATASFSFKGTDSGSGVASFECRLDEGAWIACTSPQKYEGLGEGSHKFEVRALDKAGNADASPAVFAWLVDTKAPDTEITAQPSVISPSATASFNFQGTDAGSGVASFECRLDEGAWAACSSPQPYSSLTEGSHKFEVRALDKAGNADSSPAIYSWLVDTKAPDTELTAQPAAISPSASASFSFKGTDSGSGVASFECRLDEGAWTACTSPQKYEGLGEGSHKFEVRALDKAGNADASPAVFAWLVDTKAPDTELTAQPSAISPSATASFSFKGTDTGSGVASFECRLDEGAWAACSSPQPYSSLTEGNHKFEVRAIDKAGNPDASSAIFSWLVDTKVPDTELTAQPSAISPSASASFSFKGTDTGGSGIASFECRLDSEAGAWTACSSPQPYASLSEGTHKFEVRTLDKAGNADGSPVTYSWLVDTKAPDTELTAQPAAISPSAAASFSFKGTDSGSGIASLECRLDSSAPEDWKVCTSPQLYSSLAEGAHKFEVRALDKAGNADSSPAAFSWLVDTKAPDTELTAQPAAISPSAAASFNFKGTDAGSGIASFECRLDEGAWIACTSPQPYSSLTEGNHKFEVRALDKAGNADGSPAVYSWLVDTKAPDTELTAQPTAISSSSSASFSFKGTDSGSGIASFECRLDSEGAWSACSSPQPYASLSEGTHKFEVRALDKAGNADTSPVVFTWLVDTKAPDTELTAQPSAISPSASASFGFKGTDTGSGVASFECRLDEGAWAACSLPQPYSSLAEGTHKFEVRALDKAGNPDVSPATFAWLVDTKAPDTELTAQPAAISPSAAASFSFKGTDSGSGIASLECRLDSSAPEDWKVCTSPQLYSSLAEGAHKFEVRALDKAGNADSSPAAFSWLVDTKAPDTELTAQPAAISPSAAASFNFKGTDAGSGIASFECRLDEGAWTACTSPQKYEGLGEGSHKFEVRALDKAGNADTSPVVFTWLVDTKAPDTEITAQPSVISPSASASFSFKGTDTGSGIASFECRLDEGAWTACTSPQPYSSLTEGNHKFEVRAIDKAGNPDASSAIFSWLVDTKAPDTELIAQPSAISPSASASFGFKGTDTGSGVASFECRLDEGAWTACTSPQPYSSLTEGNHKFEVRALDKAGNPDASPATFAWLVDTKAPDTELTAQPTAISSSSSASFSFKGTDSGSGIASFECRLDSEVGAWTACSSPQPYSSLSEGNHKFEVRALDKAGNADASPATFAWQVDTKAPDTELTAQPAAISPSAAASFSFKGTDSGSGIASFECRLDEGAWSGCTSPQPYASLSEGTHKFEVRALDKAGNADASPATFGWLIDTKTPDTELTAQPSAISPSASASFSFKGTDTGSGVASFECRLDEGTWAACSSPQPYSSLAEGTHKFEVRALDKAGNPDVSPATFAWLVDTKAPDTELTAQPAAISPSAAASFSFKGTDSGSGIASLECRLNEGAWTTCGSPQKYESLTEGNHKFEVRAIDKAGNPDTSPATFAWLVDTKAPDTELTAQPTAISSSSSASFSFKGTDSGSGIASFECRLDSEVGAWTACSSPQPYSSLSEGNHKFEVRALDKAGNADASPATFAWQVDTKAPDTELTAQPAAISPSAAASFSFKGTDSGSGIASFECRLDEGAWSGCTSPQPYASLSEGTHKFEVRALDKAGNADASPATFGWLIDTKTPDTELTAQPSAISPSASASFSFKGTDTGSGVASFECRLDEGAWAACSSPQPYSSLAEGTHKFEVRALDKAGNPDASSAIFSWLVDTKAPDTELTAQPSAISPSASASFGFKGTDTGSGVASFECRLDEGAWTACTSPQPYSSLTEGNHKFEVRALDKAGNPDASPATFAWLVDTKAPDTELTAQPAAISPSASASLSFKGTDSGSGVASFECRLDEGAWAACSSPQPYSSLAEGTHKFEVRALDKAGNPDASSAIFSWLVDTKAPDTELTAQPSAISPSASASFGFKGTDTGSGVASFECRLDEGAWTACTSPQPYSSLTEGNHKFEVRTLDKAGNADASPATFSWEVDTKATDTELVSAPAAISATSEASFSFKGTDAGSGVASFECRLDSEGTWNSCAAPQKYELLADGTHKFEVRALDKAGNPDTSPATFAWLVDTKAPDTELTAQPTAISSSSSASFSFKGTDSGSGIASFECRLDSEVGAWTACTSPQPYSSLTDGSHKFEARAIDKAGNADASPATFAWLVDTKAPDTELTAQPAAISPSAAASFSFKGTDSGSGVASFECRLDEGAWTACTSPQKYEGLGEGNHKFEVRAIDKAGNPDASSAIFSWQVDTKAPDTELTAQPTTISPSATASFGFKGTDTGSGVASFECRLDSEAGAWTACSSPQKYEGLGDGSHKFEVRALDKAGNADTSPVVFTWLVDTKAPDTELTAQPAAISPSAAALFSFKGTDTGSGVASFECRLDSEVGAWTACTSPQPYSSLTDGSHKFEVRALDKAGNPDASSAIFSWLVDTKAPDTELTAQPAAISPSAAASLSFKGTDSGSGIASFECRLDSEGAWNACTSPQPYASLSEGTHKFEVRALDKAGNADASPATFGWLIDTKTPDTELTAQPSAISPSASASFSFKGTDTGSGVASFECRLDEGTWNACSSPQPYSSLTEGNHKFEVRTLDKAGNADASPAIFNWLVDTKAPDTELIAQPSAISPSASASFNFKGTDTGSGVASFECRLNEGAWTTCGSLQKYESLTEGNHKFEVRTLDKAGNADASPVVFNWQVDTKAPETELTAQPTAISPSASASFSFKGTDSGSGVASFECRLDSEGAWNSCSSPQKFEGLTEGNHKFEVRAIDKAGNPDASSAIFSWQVDTKAPDTELTAQPTAISPSASASFAFKGADTGSGIASFECRLDESAWGACASPQKYELLADGTHKFEVWAIDKAGNPDASPAIYAWQVDTKAPDTELTAQPSAISPSASASFNFKGTDTGSGVASFECRLDEGAWNGCTSPQPHSSLTEGNHKFEVRTLDKAGNADASPAIFNWLVDTKAPDTELTAQPAAISPSAAASFSFKGTDTGSGVASFECRLDEGAWSGCSSPQKYESLADGPHEFEVRAIDKAGNVDSTLARFEWTSDTVAPNTQITIHPANPSSSGSTSFAFGGIDSGGSGIASLECRLNEGAWSACASPQKYEGLTDGPHDFEVRAFDKAGNADPSPADFGWTIDSTAPGVGIDSGPTGPTNDATPSFSFHTDPGVSVVCSIDTGAPDFGPCTALDSHTSATPLEEGPHTFRVRAIDTAENQATATRDFLVDVTGPVTQIDSGPSPVSTLPDASFAAKGSDSGSGVASLECRIDSAFADAWTPCPSPQKYTLLTDGLHKFEVRAFDNAGNVDQSPAAYDWRVDTKTPSTAIVTQPPAISSSAEATFDLEGTDEGSGIASFECRLDEGAWSACASPQKYESLANGSHKFEARAIDKAGHADSSPAIVNWQIDTLGPETELMDQPPAITSSATASFSFQGTDSDTGIASFECRLDEGAWTACASPQPYSSLADGNHKFEAKAIDKAGNPDASPVAFSWEVDTTGPDTTIVDQPPTISPSTTASFSFAATDTGGSGVVSFECRLDSSAPGAWNGCTSPQPYSSLTEGNHKFEVRALDKAGNADASPATFAWQVDITGPNTEIDSGPETLTSRTSAEFEFSGSDGAGTGIASFECRLDSSEPGDWEPCDSSALYTSLADGPHAFEVRAIDQAGNPDQDPPSFAWTIDSIPPEVVIESGPSGSTNDSTPTFTFTSEPGAAFECSVDTGAPDFESCSAAGSHTPSTPLAGGSYTFRVRATDSAQNQAVATRGFTVDTTIPAPPVLNATVPASPANHNTPMVVGSAAPSSIVRLYSGANCSGSPITTVTTVELESGIAVSVPDDSTTDFRATATSTVGNTSACSMPRTYVEDSSAPTSQIDSAPETLGGSAEATFTFSGSDGAGSGIASFECRLDTTGVGGWAPCTSPKAYASLSVGTHKFEVRALDKAGNADVSPATHEWVIKGPGGGEKEPEGKEKEPEGKQRGIARFVRSIRNIRTGTALLIFEVPGPGLLTARSPEVSVASPRKNRTAAARRLLELKLRQRRILPAKVVASEPGELAIQVKLTAAGKELLQKVHRLKVRVQVSFEPTSGEPQAWKVLVPLEQRAVPRPQVKKAGP